MNTSTLTIVTFLSCLGAALLLGIILAFFYKMLHKTSQSFTLTLALLPAVVAIVIMVVNGNLGAGVAVAGAFSLVRFRSAPGSAKEISMIFLAMGCGLMCGMGYLLYAAIFTIVLILAIIVLTKLNFGASKESEKQILRITIPEDLNYNDIFEEVLEKYASFHKIQSVKTTNMGSMFKLAYQIQLKDDRMAQSMMNELRTRNGNLEISIAQEEVTNYEL